MSLKRRKTLGVCGDSFMSQTKNNKKGKDKHFIDFLSKKFFIVIKSFRDLFERYVLMRSRNTYFGLSIFFIYVY